MIKKILFVWTTILIVASCSNTEQETELNGLWKGENISVQGDSVVHKLENDIEFVFDRPDYSFNSKIISEQGSYQLRDQFLILETKTDSIPQMRQIEIIAFSGDSLHLLLVDSLETKQVLFIRQ